MMRLASFPTAALVSSLSFGMSAANTSPLPGPRDSTKGKGKLVNITIDSQYKTKISPWIFGANIIGSFKDVDDDMNLTFFRLGGNRLSAYNWENNYSHAGSDYNYQNDLWLCGVFNANCDEPGGVVTAFVEKAFANRASAVLLTIPILDHVAYKKTRGDVCLTKPTKDWQCPNRDHYKESFRQSKPKKDGPLSLKPNKDDAYVYQDEFVNWVKNRFKNHLSQGKKIFYSMDNEPGLWGATHNRVRPGGKYCEHNPSYPELLKRNIDYARAVKLNMKDSLVFGPAHYGWLGMKTLQNFASCSGDGGTPFYKYYMEGVRRAAGKQKSLVDVYDFHWYPEVRSNGKKGQRITGKATDKDTVVARVQAARSYWDPQFDEKSWISQDDLRSPVRLLPRVQSWIAQYNPGMGIAITEYTLGGEDHISGAIAQVDALGSFAREGVFAASFWPLAPRGSTSKYIRAAFKMFRNYDGKRSTFGDQMISAISDQVDKVAVYASTHSKDPKKLVLILINKSFKVQSTRITLNHKHSFKAANIFTLTEKSTEPEKSQKNLKKGTKTHLFDIPPMSVSTIELQ
ncbi:glycoside hydrolase family 44 protein [Pseudobacteriovorax antillogorgiicola]|uniref:Glycoside hydrolase family 44 n=1 Tax=Pseudobacteriovorax antillogorgiicola TaxID=1513793 RepID=A0A1Y6BVI3_9BACT|nr:glycoside hydrolase family 44 protein [Pseudobacteriovorax antillogorgiicola]TCS52270.1 glycosyl hydrolase family 44 [Pseudobacteriovorax antillogorgiicola]SMF30877.1 Glycoside hydrolase family 44 [Pseudobacteriovorax antillogorgiicola]